MKQMEQILTFVNPEEDHILMGDFNTLNLSMFLQWSQFFSRVFILEDFTKEYLQQVLKASPEFNFQPLSDIPTDHYRTIDSLLEKGYVDFLRYF
jgi:hypothetical protein